MNNRSYSQKVMLSIISIFKLTFNEDGVEKKKKIHVYVFTEPHISEAQKKYMNKRFSDPVTSMHRGRLNSLKLSAAWDLQQGRQHR